MLADLGWPALAAALASRCATERGAEAAKALAPAADRAEAMERFALISELRALIDEGHTLCFGGIADVRAHAGHAHKGGSLDPEALWACAEAASGLHKLRARGCAHPEIAPRLAAIASEMPALDHVAAAIFDALLPGGEGLADHASQDLGPLRRRVERLAGELSARAQSIASDPALAASLQDRFVTEREGRLVVPVRADSRGNVRGIVHGASQSGSTLFIEPEALVEIGNRLKLAQIAVAEEEARILAALSAIVGAAAEAIDAALAIATRLDVAFASAKLADTLGANAFELSRGEVSFSRLRHPLIVLAGKHCVPNDLFVDAGTALLISGPNAGGKTVAMTAAGLAAVMARMGLGVCADPGARVLWLEGLFTDIGDRQSLDSDLSTFSAHLLKLREMCERAAPGTLILVDEIGAGTDPDQGAALAQAALERLTALGATVIATTHAEQLKAVAASHPRFKNAAVGFDLERMAPTFSLTLGMPGSSGALALARRMNLPEELCARAEAILGTGRASVEALAAELAEAQTALASEREEIARAREALDADRAQVDEALRRAREAQKKAHVAAYAETVAALRAARDELARIRSEIRTEGRRLGKTAKAENLAARERRVDRLAREVANRAPGDDTEHVPADPADLVPGQAVRVRSLQRKGVVMSHPDRGRIAVQVGTMRTQVAVTDVALASDGGQKTEPSMAQHRRQPTRWNDGGRDQPSEREQVSAWTIDLRGERADDALRRVDEFLDRAILDEREVVFIVHGHGTGALRTALRAHVSDHPLVRQWRAGEPAEGGDGVTVAWIA